MMHLPVVAMREELAPNEDIIFTPQQFSRSGIPHHRGSVQTFTAVRVSHRSYNNTPAGTGGGE
jgi:hypothetical protein